MTASPVPIPQPARLAQRPWVLGRTLIIYAASLLVAGWTFEIWQIRSDRSIVLQASRDDLTTLASSLSNELSAMIYDGVGAAMAAANELHGRTQPTPSTGQQTQTLANMLTGGDYVLEVFIATPTRYVAAARVEPNSGVSGPPAWARAMLATQGSDAFVGPPLHAQQEDSKAVFPIARRVSQPGSEPQWAGALIAVESLHRVYSKLPLDSGAVVLVSSDGIVLMRSPSAAGEHFVGLSATGSTAFTAGRDSPQPLTLVDGTNPLTGVPRLFAVAKVPNYPLLAAAGRDVEAALRPWALRTQSSLRAAIVSSLAWLALTVALYIVLRRHYLSLRRSEERFELVAQASNDGIWDWDLAADRVYYSGRFKERLGHAANSEFAPVPDTFWSMLHPDDIERTRSALQRHLLDHVPYEQEYRLCGRNGEYRWFKGRGQAVWDAAGVPARMAGSITDIHERKLTEQSLHQAQVRELRAREELAQHLLRIQEQERQRLADELHDSVGQDLSLIKNRAQLILQQPNLPRSIAEQLQALAELAAAVIGEVRSVVQNLRPLHIEQLGLTDALDTLLDKTAAASSLAIERRLEDIDGVLNRTAATHIYRIVQEALDDTVRQGRARHCRVWLERDLHCLRLTIANDAAHDAADTGPSHAPGRNAVLGQASINERVRMLDATCQITEHPAGTAIVIEIPISEVLAHRQTEPSAP